MVMKNSAIEKWSDACDDGKLKPEPQGTLEITLAFIVVLLHGLILLKAGFKILALPKSARPTASAKKIMIYIPLSL